MPDKAQNDDRVMTLVELSLARSSHDRESYLRSACAGDSELFQQVWNYVEWEQRMRGFLLDPLCSALSEQHFEPGTLLDGRFRIVREVAQGGMGIVYEAFDEKLERRIAVKCAKAGFGKRLPPEVRNARAISHPNVCKIFEIHTASTDQGDIDFLAMEFLDGETLAERLRGGPLPQKEARTIARQLCAGLAEAHRNDVIHGDLKSSNVILTNGTDGSIRAVITDFGLARQPGASQRAGQSGEPGGTPDYMAPELWKGEKASVASDIYALGVILYELVSGRRPHAAELSSAKSWEQRLTSKPPAVHSKWDRILARCLDPDPARRFRDADEVAQALAPPQSRRWLLGAAAAVVLAIASGVATYEHATAPQESVRLALLPFETGADTSLLAKGLSQDAAGQLAHLKGNSRTRLKFIPLDDTFRNKVDTLDKARVALHATHALHGTLRKEKEQLFLQAYLTDLRSGVNTRAWTAAYDPQSLRYAPVALAGMVTGALRLPALPASVNAAAQQDYIAGRGYTRRNSTVDAALPLLERAVAADPDSPLTHAALAEAQWFKYFLTRDRTWLARTEDSVRQAEYRNPDLAAVHRVAGLLKGNSGWYEQAAAEYRRAIELEPNNSDAFRRLGRVYESNNQLDDALAAYRRAAELEPGYFKTPQDLGAFYFRRANYEQAIREFEKTVALSPDEPDAHFALGTGYSNIGRFSEAETELRAALRLRETPSALINLSFVLMCQRRDQEAISYLRSSLSGWPERSVSWMNLAIAYRRVNQAGEAERCNRRGLEVAEREMTEDPRNGPVRSYAAYFCAWLRDRKRAESEIAQALQLSPNDSETRLTAAMTYEALGRREDTLALLTASGRDVLAHLSRWPDMEDLHRDPRFLQLLAKYQLK